MSFLQSLRNARQLARWVLACFALVTGVAIPSPLFPPCPLYTSSSPRD